MTNPLALPTDPGAARLFFGFRAQALQERPEDDEETKARKRSQFFNELGQTFMPGTPLMQAPLGLAAYLPVVIDPPPGAGLPDEVAIIAYASLDTYQSTRETSLSRRMYTRAHAAVFQMDAAVAAFPTGIGTPATATGSIGEVSLWHLFDEPTDWQDGDARFLLLCASSSDGDFKKSVTDKARETAQDLRDTGCDQLLAGCADTFAALWLHSPDDAREIDTNLVVPQNTEIFRDLRFQSGWVRGDAELGLPITGPCAYNWRFSRDVRYFV